LWQRQRLRRLILFTLVLFAVQTAHADTIPSPRFTKKAWMISAGLFTTGVLVATTLPFNSFEQSIYNDFRPLRTATEIDDYTQYAPAIAVFVLSASGVKGRSKLPAQVVVYGLSTVTGGIVTQSLKRIVNRERPDKSDNRSFPSGHTSTAFIAAELLHQEYGHRSVVYSIAGYGTAALTGYLRLYNNKHWLGDILAGAAVGIASTKLVYWAKDVLKEKQSKKKRTVSPAF